MMSLFLNLLYNIWFLQCIISVRYLDFASMKSNTDNLNEIHSAFQ